MTGEPGIRFYAGAPPVLASGDRICSLCVIDSEPRTNFSSRVKQALALLAQQVVDQLEIRRLRRSQQVS